MSELYDLPAGWEWKKLLEVAEIYNKTIKIEDDKQHYCIGLEHIESGTGRLIDFELSNGNSIKSNKVLFRKGMVLYGKLRPYLNKVWKAEFSGIATTEIIPFNANINLLNSDYFAHYLRTSFFVNNAMKNISGARMPRITTKYLKNEAYIPLPPLQEQKRIVKKLDLLFEKIDRAIALHQQNMDEADAFMASVLNDVFGELEAKYGLLKLDNFALFQNGFAFKSKEFNTVGKGLQVIRIGNVVDVNKNPVYINERDEFKKYVLKENDIVISMTGTRTKKDYLFVRIVNTSNSYLNQRVGKIQSQNNSCHRFLYYFLLSNTFRDKIFEFETGAVNQGNISGKAIMKSEIANTPVPIQQKAIAYLDEISDKLERVKQVQKEKMTSLIALKASILDQAFRGKL